MNLLLREINLNVGCPSDRVQEGRFGACLMAEPDLVAEGVAAMRNAVSVPVTVKCRIGIDDQDADEDLDQFIRKVAAYRLPHFHHPRPSARRKGLCACLSVPSKPPIWRSLQALR